MQSVIDACERGEINGKIRAVIANKSGIYAIDRAVKHGIPYRIFTIKEYGDAESRDKAIADYLSSLDIDLIVLAGYLSIVTSSLLDIYEGRIINIHPILRYGHVRNESTSRSHRGRRDGERLYRSLRRRRRGYGENNRASKSKSFSRRHAGEFTRAGARARAYPLAKGRGAAVQRIKDIRSIYEKTCVNQRFR